MVSVSSKQIYHIINQISHAIFLYGELVPQWSGNIRQHNMLNITHSTWVISDAQQKGMDYLHISTYILPKTQI